MKIIFFGSDDFALAHLECLLGTDSAGVEQRAESKGQMAECEWQSAEGEGKLSKPCAISSMQVLACVTQPDRARDRGMKVTISPIKECALVHNIPVLQPEDLSDQSFIKELKQLNADVFVVIAYGKFLPQTLLDIPSVCAINVHGSYLPKYRGAAPINWAIINGEKETGVSIIKLNTKMDAGEIIARKKIDIKTEDTSVTLRQRMIKEGKGLLLETLPELGGEVKGIAQGETEVTFAPKLTKEMGKIDWNKPAAEICNLVRGLLPWPSAYTFYEGKMLKILASEISEETGGNPGEVIRSSKEGLFVATGQGSLVIKKVHYESSKPMDAAAFSRGHELKEGSLFREVK